MNQQEITESYINSYHTINRLYYAAFTYQNCDFYQYIYVGS